MRILFTDHAEYRMKQRKILREEILFVISSPKRTRKAHGLYYFEGLIQRGTIEVCVERRQTYLRIITYIGCKMEIRYDKKADAMYISFRTGDFATNKKIDDLTIVDMDAQGNLLGIELLRVSKRFPESTFASISVKGLSVN